MQNATGCDEPGFTEASGVRGTESQDETQYWNM